MIIGSCEGKPCEAEGVKHGFYMNRNQGYEPHDGCDGDPVPHSDICEQHGGEDDYEAFLSGWWMEWFDHPDEVCQCVRRGVSDWRVLANRL